MVLHEVARADTSYLSGLESVSLVGRVRVCAHECVNKPLTDLYSPFTIPGVQPSDRDEGEQSGEAKGITRAADVNRGATDGRHAADEGKDHAHGRERRAQGECTLKPSS